MGSHALEQRRQRNSPFLCHAPCDCSHRGGGCRQPPPPHPLRPPACTTAPAVGVQLRQSSLRLLGRRQEQDVTARTSLGNDEWYEWGLDLSAHLSTACAARLLPIAQLLPTGPTLYCCAPTSYRLHYRKRQKPTKAAIRVTWIIRIHSVMSDDNKAPLLKLEHYRRLVDNSLNALVLCLLGALVFALYQLYVSVADTAVDTYSLVISFCLGIGLALVMSIVIILIFRKSVIPGG